MLILTSCDRSILCHAILQLIDCHVIFDADAVAASTDAIPPLTSPRFISHILMSFCSLLPLHSHVLLCGVSGLDVEIVATYQSANKEPRVALHTVTVPLLLACRPRPALKSGLHKLTLSTLHPALPLSELFEDFLSSAKEYMDIGDGTSSASSLGFQLWASSEQILGPGSGSGPGANNGSGSGSGGPSSVPLPAVVSILVSKNAGRYRVQSDSLPALLLVLSELERRLSIRIEASRGEGGIDREGAEEGGGGRAVTCDEEYPLQEYFACIRAHFELRNRLAEQLSLLNDSAHQYRMVQKRLLVRFKDRNPTPLLGLDALMTESYHSLLRTSESHCTSDWTRVDPITSATT